MEIRSNASPVCLGKNQALSLFDAKGSQISCRQGELWITQDHDLRDIVLEPGQSFTLDRDGAALVSAMAPSSVQLRVPTAGPRGLSGTLARWLGRRATPPSFDAALS